MATKILFTNDNYDMEVFINQFNKITFQTNNNDDESDYTVLDLDNEDIKKLINVLKQLLKDNNNG